MMSSSAPTPLLDADGIARLREALAAANFTSQGLTERLGPALSTTAFPDKNAVLATLGTDEAIIVLHRLFQTRQVLPASAVESALRPLPLSEALSAELVEHVDGGIRAKIELRPVEHWWFLSDPSPYMTPGSGQAPDHVLNMNPTTRMLANWTSRRPVETALDLGTGNGLQAAYLSRHAQRVTGTDISPRALRFAATNAALNRLDWELLQGDFYEPVSGRQFEQVVSNPPFVVNAGEPKVMYRDSGRQGDGLCAELIATAPKLLAPGGIMNFLGNWLHIANQDWTDRLRGWLGGTGLDAIILQDSFFEPDEYVGHWVTSEHPSERPARIAAWLDWFKANNVEGVGVGVILLRAGGHDDPTVQIHKHRLPSLGPIGNELVAWFDGCDVSRSLRGEALWDARVRTADGLQLRSISTRGPDGWEIKTQLLQLDSGPRWKLFTVPVTAAIVSACDGVQPLRDILSTLATTADIKPTELAKLADQLAPHLHRLIEHGMLILVTDNDPPIAVSPAASYESAASAELATKIASS